jgi:hypothetical protein
MTRRPPRPFLTCQIAVIASLLGLLALAPPRHGVLWLVDPSGNAGPSIQIALSHGARLLGTGPLPGSIIVVGDRAALGRAVRAAGIVMLAAPFAGCGPAPATQA